ncbi:MAG: PilZ domain-containing protein [Thermodesulfobacteriota bacterium]|nr:PilZ domain-containing protein [Thermodesulfobacteriota bacterium]
MKPEGKDPKPRIGIVNIERRRYPRFSIDLPIEYYPIHSSASHTGRTLNASEGGLLVYLPEKMEVGQSLKLKLFFSSGFNLNTIEVITEVIWIDIHLEKDWGDYRTGLKFVDISSEDLSRLRDFLTSLSK